jgi:hypothetical protein
MKCHNFRRSHHGRRLCLRDRTQVSLNQRVTSTQYQTYQRNARNSRHTTRHTTQAGAPDRTQHDGMSMSCPVSTTQRGQRRREQRPESTAVTDCDCVAVAPAQGEGFGLRGRRTERKASRYSGPASHTAHTARSPSRQRNARSRHLANAMHARTHTNALPPNKLTTSRNLMTRITCQ